MEKLCDQCLLQYICLKNLIQYLINRTIRILVSLKAEPGEKENEITEAILKGIHKSVNIRQNQEGLTGYLQFSQNLVDRMRQRLFDDSKNKTLLEDIHIIKIAKNYFDSYLNRINEYFNKLSFIL